jgi:hypothetical protein
MKPFALLAHADKDALVAQRLSELFGHDSRTIRPW